MEGKSERIFLGGGDSEISPRMETVERAELRWRGLQKHGKSLEGSRKSS